jgi:hypothetical protein
MSSDLSAECPQRSATCLSKSGLSGSTLSSVGSGNKSGKESGDGFIKLLILLYILAEMKAAKMDVSAMELLLPDDRQELEDLATDLVAKTNTLAGRLHPVMQASVGDLVCSMNCY